MLDRVTSTDFRQHLNERFLIRPHTSPPVEVELISIDDLGEGSAGEDSHGRRQPFSVVFRSLQLDSYLLQRIYTVEHEQMGSLDIFLVPIGPDQHGMRYEAIFA